MLTLCLTNAVKGSRGTAILISLKSGSLNVTRRYGSALYISGKNATKHFSYLTPCLDFDEQLCNVEALQKNLAARGIKKSAIEYAKMWDFYKLTADDVAKLESKVTQLGKEMKKLYQDKSTADERKQDIERLQAQMSIAKEDHKTMRDSLWDLDEKIIGQLLKLPNVLDERTPLEQPVVLKTVGEPTRLDRDGAKSHLEAGAQLNLLEYKNAMECYLLNEAAHFEHGVLGLARDILAKDEMLRIAGVDFARSLIVEAAGLDYQNSQHSFVLQQDGESAGRLDRLHLVGSASLASFLAMHAKQFIQARDLPARYFTTGRQYVPISETVTPMGLYTICQSSSVQAFVLVKRANPQDYYEQFDRLVNTTCELYEKICDHYRVLLKPATDLATAESMRVSFELWSPFLEEYVEVGHVSSYDAYLSKRLLITYQAANGRDYPRAISGTVLSVQRLLGCLLEQNPTRFTIPEKIAEHMPGT